MNLVASFKKLLPNVKPDIITEAMKAFKLGNVRDMISREDFDMVFADDQSALMRSSMKGGSMGGSKMLVKQDFTQKRLQDEDEAFMYIKKLDNAFLREGISPSVAFKAADSNHSGTITVDELKLSIKKFISDETISLIDLKKIMMALDVNRNGTIEEEEFITMIEKARNSTVTVIEAAKPSRIISDEAALERKAKLPLKENVGDKP